MQTQTDASTNLCDETLLFGKRLSTSLLKQKNYLKKSIKYIWKNIIFYKPMHKRPGKVDTVSEPGEDGQGERI